MQTIILTKPRHYRYLTDTLSTILIAYRQEEAINNYCTDTLPIAYQSLTDDF